jgi:uncharacterized membrane protein
MLSKLCRKTRRNKENLKWIFIGLFILVTTVLAVNYVRVLLEDKYNKPSFQTKGLLYAE